MLSQLGVLYSTVISIEIITIIYKAYSAWLAAELSFKLSINLAKFSRS
jgi:hypothetical protein